MSHHITELNDQMTVAFAIRILIWNLHENLANTVNTRVTQYQSLFLSPSLAHSIFPATFDDRFQKIIEINLCVQKSQKA